MSNLIQLFETMGQNAGLQSRASQQAAIREAALDTGLRDALLEGDNTALEQALTVDGNFFCALFKP